MEQALEVKWFDHGREPQCPPNPAYPNGIDLDTTLPGDAVCTAALPYPAKRCGYYLVTCRVCRSNVMVTTAGRPDDPRWVRLACQLKGVA